MLNWFSRCFLAACLVAAPVFTLSAAEYAAFANALESINRDDLGRHVAVLADDTFEGREAGTRGGHAAAGYLVEQLKKYDIRPAGTDGSWFQSFDANHRNVLALLEGSDPKLKHQCLIVGAHYDHVGYGSTRTSYGPLGYIHNGADDNASGTAALLELIEAFHTLGQAPRRSILFAFWDGEEKGLLGSRHWLSRPTVPLNGVRLVVNLDMVGRLRNDRLEVTGTRTSWGMRQTVSRQAQGSDLQLDFPWKITENSDHWPFYINNKPILMFHTGMHPDYHRPSDTPEKVNPEGIERVSRVLFRLMVHLSDADELPGFRSAARSETPADARVLEGTLSPLPSRLGVWWDAEPSEASPGLRITNVVPDSAASQAGVRSNDRLLRVNGEPIRHGDDLRAAVLAAQRELTLELQRPDETQSRELRVQLSGERVRVGISLREDDAEPGAVMLTRVVPGSPADQAGLKALDRLYEIGGERFADTEDFLSKLNAAQGPVELLTERNGRLSVIRLTLAP